MDLLRIVGDFGSSCGLFGNGLFSLSDESLDLLPVGNNLGGDRVNLLLDLGLLATSDNLDLLLQFLLLGNKSRGSLGKGVDGGACLGNSLSRRFDS